MATGPAPAAARNDTLVAACSDTLSGLAGDDVLDGESGNESVNGTVATNVEGGGILRTRKRQGRWT